MIELAVEPHEVYIVIGRRGFFESGRQPGEACAFLGASRASPHFGTHEALHLPARAQQLELFFDVNLGHEQAALRQDHDQVLARKPLNRLANRPAADACHLAQHKLRDGRTGRNL